MMPQPKYFNAATSQWVHGAAITDPTGGTTTDSQGRTAISSILAALRAAGVIAGATSLNLTYGWNAGRSQVVLLPAITAPSGGATVDTEGRAAISSILAVLGAAGIVGGGSAGPSGALNAATNQMCEAAAIVDVSGGSTVDSQFRTAVNAALAAMRDAALITGGTGQ